MALQNSWNSSIPIKSSQGGTGYTTFNLGDILTGNSSGALTTLGVGTNGYALIADSTQSSGLKWSSVAVTPLTVNANSGSATVANNALTLSGTAPLTVSGSGSTLTASLGTVPVTLGGTGATSLDNGILVGQGNSAVRTLKVYQANVIGGNANGDAQSKTISSNDGSLALSYTDSNIDFSLSTTTQTKLGAWFAQSQLTSSPTSVTNGNIYYLAGSNSLNLPLAYSTGNANPSMKIVGTGSCPWTLTVPNGTSVRFGNMVTKSDGTGSIASTNNGDCLELSALKSSPNTWYVSSSQGNLNIT